MLERNATSDIPGAHITCQRRGSRRAQKGELIVIEQDKTDPSSLIFTKIKEIGAAWDGNMEMAYKPEVKYETN